MRSPSLFNLKLLLMIEILGAGKVLCYNDSMSELITLHPSQNNPRLTQVITDCLRLGGVIAYPTDSGYALGCCSKDKEALKRIRTMRNLSEDHRFTLICRDLAEISRHAKVSNAQFRILKKYLPGGYTFILEVARGAGAVGVRIPDHPIPLMIVEGLNEPLVSTTLILPDQEAPLCYPEDVADALEGKVDIIIDGGYAGFEPTSVVDLTGEKPRVIRQGSGNLSEFLS
jgi:tRNA threonylcarbamoyl adenosine modification protein (Sua5/YciO/YrdC/YwlC family)